MVDARSLAHVRKLLERLTRAQPNAHGSVKPRAGRRGRATRLNPPTRQQRRRQLRAPYESCCAASRFDQVSRSVLCGSAVSGGQVERLLAAGSAPPRASMRAGSIAPGSTPAARSRSAASTLVSVSSIEARPACRLTLRQLVGRSRRTRSRRWPVAAPSSRAHRFADHQARRSPSATSAAISAIAAAVAAPVEGAPRQRESPLGITDREADPALSKVDSESACSMSRILFEPPARPMC
jgi:hypothetical protein